MWIQKRTNVCLHVVKIYLHTKLHVYTRRRRAFCVYTNSRLRVILRVYKMRMSRMRSVYVRFCTSTILDNFTNTCFFARLQVILHVYVHFRTCTIGLPNLSTCIFAHLQINYVTSTCIFARIQANYQIISTCNFARLIIYKLTGSRLHVFLHVGAPIQFVISLLVRVFLRVYKHIS